MTRSNADDAAAARAVRTRRGAAPRASARNRGRQRGVGAGRAAGRLSRDYERRWREQFANGGSAMQVLLLPELRGPPDAGHRTAAAASRPAARTARKGRGAAGRTRIEGRVGPKLIERRRADEARVAARHDQQARRRTGAPAPRWRARALPAARMKENACDDDQPPATVAPQAAATRLGPARLRHWCRHAGDVGIDSAGAARLRCGASPEMSVTRRRPIARRCSRRCTTSSRDESAQAAPLPVWPLELAPLPAWPLELPPLPASVGAMARCNGTGTGGRAARDAARASCSSAAPRPPTIDAAVETEPRDAAPNPLLLRRCRRRP